MYASEDEFRALAEFLSLPFEQFLADYTENISGFVSLKSQSNGHCVFYDGGCLVYKYRPTQCRTYPFWPEIMKDQLRWNKEGNVCKGMNSGKFWNKASIQEELVKNEQQLLVAKKV